MLLSHSSRPDRPVLVLLSTIEPARLNPEAIEPAPSLLMTSGLSMKLSLHKGAARGGPRRSLLPAGHLRLLSGANNLKGG